MVFWGVTGSGRASSAPTGDVAVSRLWRWVEHVRPLRIVRQVHSGEPCVVGADLDQPLVAPGWTPYVRLPGNWLNESVARAIRATHIQTLHVPAQMRDGLP